MSPTQTHVGSPLIACRASTMTVRPLTSSTRTGSAAEFAAVSDTSAATRDASNTNDGAGDGNAPRHSPTVRSTASPAVRRSRSTASLRTN
ncbi:MAG: hypothetical protein EB148_01425 [Actinobacteria bacterium]|nr:hypothetical protein [Actinomycetota bacterium]